MADEGAGASLTFATTTNNAFEVTSIQAQGISRESLETTHHGTTGGHKTFQPGDFRDPGTIAVTVLYDPNGPRPPVAAAAEVVTITYPVPSGDTSGATEASTAFVTDWDAPALEIDSIMEATMTLKRSGVITYTTSS